MRRFAAVFSVLPLLAACATTPADAGAAPGPVPTGRGGETAALEPLYGVRFDERGLTVRINSNGCTRKEDAEVHVDRDTGETRLAVVRRRPDPCRSFARGAVDLTWSLSELGLKGGEEVRFLNPIVTW
jgi:hypothetical protein